MAKNHQACLAVIALPLVAMATEAQAQQHCSLVCYGELTRTRDGSDAQAVEAAQSKILKIVDEKGADPFNRIVSHGNSIARMNEVNDIIQGTAELTDLTVGRIPVGGEAFSAIIGLQAFTIDKLTKVNTAIQEKAIDQMLAEIERADSAKIAEMRGMSAAEAHRYFWGADGAAGLANGTTLSQLATPETRGALALAGVDMLNRRLSAFAGTVVQNQQQLQEVAGKLNQLTTKFEDFKAKTTVDIDRLKIAQQKQQQVLQSLSTKVGQHGARLDTLERIMFSQLKPEERLKLVREGGFPGISLSKAEIEQLEKAALLSEVQGYASRASQAAGDIAAIGDVFGIDIGKEAEFVQTAAAIATNATMIASGEPFTMLAGAGGIARMFGSKGGASDATAKELRALRQEMRRNHQETMARLADISGRIDKGFDAVLDSNDANFRQLLFIGKIADEALATNLSRCEQVAALWRPTSASDSYDARAARINDEGGTLLLQDCRQGVSGISNLQAGKARVSATFLASALRPAEGGFEAEPTKIESDEFDKWRARIYDPTRAYTMARASRGIGAGACPANQLLFMSLTSSTDRLGGAQAFLNSLAADCTSGKKVTYRAYRINNTDYPVDVDNVLATPLYSERILSMGRNALDVSPLLEFVRNTGGSGPRIATRAEIAHGDQGPTGEAERYMGYVADLASFSIAQSSLLAGDLVLEAIASDLEAGLKVPGGVNLSAFKAEDWRNCGAPASVSGADYLNAICILSRNPILRYNFVRHWIASRRSTGGWSSYAAGIGDDRPNLIKAALKNHMPIEACRNVEADGSWCLNLPLNGLAIPEVSVGNQGSWDLSLPTVGEASSKRLAYSSRDRAKLISLRAEARDIARKYELSRSIPEVEEELLRAGMVVEASAQWEDYDAAAAERSNPEVI